MVESSVVTNTSNLKINAAPPSLTKSLMAGFDTISNNFWLIIFSILLDLLLWLGPHFRIKIIMESIISQVLSLPEANSSDVSDSIKFAGEFWKNFAEQFNLLTVLRTLPVGIPSLMTSKSPLEIPAGIPRFFEIESSGAVFGWIIVLILIGIVAATLYFTLISQATTASEISWWETIRVLPWSVIQVLLLTILAFILFLITIIPFSCLMSVMMFSGVGFDRFGILLVFLFGGLLLWWLLPLFFTPHGIFVNKLAIWDSIRKSIRLTRSTLPATGFLVIIIVIINEGLKLLWRVPSDSSWFTLVGIIGHSFVAASLLASSFVYYKEADEWVRAEADLTAV